MKSIFERYERLREFPRLTRVHIVEDDLGWYLKREGFNQVLDITFKNPSELRQYARCDYLVLIFEDELQ